MADSIKNYGLGTEGLLIDPHHLLPDVPPQGLTLAKNAIQDPRAGFGGAIRKRPGLARFNIVFAGGPILGGIPMPVAEFGGAPSSGGGATIGTGDVDDGTSVGTGDMTGAPGGTFDGGAASTTPAGAGAFTATTLFGGGRLIAVGLEDNTDASNVGGAGWYLTSKEFADNAIKSTMPTLPCICYSYPTFVSPFSNGIQGQPSCIGLDGKLYYAAAHGNQALGGTTNGTLPIYVTDGGTSTLLATIPKNGDTAAEANHPGNTSVRAAVMSMHAATDGFIYVAVKDKFAGQLTAGSVGRIFRVRPTTGEVVEWNANTTSGAPTLFTKIPYSVNYFQGYLYFGVYEGLDTAASVYASNGTVAVQDNSFNSDNVISCMCQYNGRLWLGTGVNKSVPTLASLFSRDPNPAPGSGTGWAGFAFDAARTGNGTNGNSYTSMVVFNDALYVAWNAPGAATKIYKVVADNPGDPTSVSYTITTAYTASPAPLNLYVDDGIIYAIASGDSSASVAATSPDGTTWTNRSANFGTLGFSARAIPVFFGMNQ